jgi:hypothetical protein
METTQEKQDQGDAAGLEQQLPSRRMGLKLLRKLLIYHSILIATIVVAVLIFPNFISQLPVGGVNELVAGGDLSVSGISDIPIDHEDIEIVNTMIRAANDLDRLGTARQLMMILMGVWLLMMPVSWVHKGIHRGGNTHDHSLDETMLILPGVVAAIVLVVQHSLALAFSLAGIVAGVQFRRALQDTFDALFILVAIGTGIAAGVNALEIAAVLTIFFCYATCYVYFFGDGLESDYAAQRKARKAQRRAMAKESQAGHEKNR